MGIFTRKNKEKIAEEYNPKIHRLARVYNDVWKGRKFLHKKYGMCYVTSAWKRTVKSGNGYEDILTSIEFIFIKGGAINRRYFNDESIYKREDEFINMCDDYQKFIQSERDINMYINNNNK